MREDPSSQKSASDVLLLPLRTAASLVRQDKIAEAKRCLSISNELISDEHFCADLIELESALITTLNQGIGDAVDHFFKANKLIDCIGTQTKSGQILHFLRSAANGYHALYNSDPSTAIANLKIADSHIKPLLRHHPELALTKTSIENAILTSTAQHYFAKGDYLNAERVYGQLHVNFTETIKVLEQSDIDNPIAFSEIFGTILEFNLTLTHQDICTLKFSDGSIRLKSSKENVEKFRKYIKEIQDTPFKSICISMSLLYDVAVIICDASVHLIDNKKEPTENLLGSLRELPRMIFEAREAGIKAGQRGERLTNFVTSVQRYSDSLLKLAKPRKESPLHVGSVIFLSVFLLLFVPTVLILKPTDPFMTFYTVSYFTVALISGFGYGALRFLPLIRQYQKLLASAKEREG